MRAWSRSDYEAQPRALLSRGSRFKPAVWRVEPEGGPLVVKDAAGAPWWSRWMARALLARERRVLERLEGIAQVPQLVARIDRSAFATTWLDGEPLEREAFRRAPRRIVENLLALIAQLHQRGIYHLDLRQRQNVLLRASGAVAVVDFGAAWRLGSWSGPFGRALAWVDRQGALKYLARYAPEELNEEEALEVLRAERWRRWWPFTPHHPRGAVEGARARLRQLRDADGDGHKP